jgi:hypothetical protein
MWRAAAVLAVASVCLGGCFVSKKPLIAEDKAVFPYEKIVYLAQGSSDRRTLIRAGSAYVNEAKSGSDDDGHVRLLKVADTLYVAEVDATENNEVQYYYELLKVDLAAKTAVAYKALAGDGDSDLGPGLSRCDREGQEQVCIDKLDAYVAYARRAIDAGAKPDTAYTIVSLE